MSDCLPQGKIKATMSDCFDFPQDLFAEILVRLPIQDLVKSTAVCKSWNSLIKNPTFISTHLEKTISFDDSTNTQLLLFRLCTWANRSGTIFSDSIREHYALRFDNEGVDEYTQLQFPRNNFKSETGCFRVAGSINGLVCLVDDMRSYIHNFILWNPIIKKFVCVPTPAVTSKTHGGFDAFIGFGFDSKTNDYKLLRFVELLDHYYLDDDDTSDEPMVEVEVEMYSLNANCWRSITHIAPKYGLSLKSPKTYGNSFVNGAIHMLAWNKDRNLILAFDVSEEVFREIPLPECLRDGYIAGTELLKYGQSIAAMTYWDGRDGNEVEQIHLWVMKEYGVAMSWTKVFTEVAKMVPRVLFFRKEEEVFVTLKDGRIASLNIKSQNRESFGVHSVESGYHVVDGYVESLVLLDKGNSCWDVNVCDEDPLDGNSNELETSEDYASSVDGYSDDSSFVDYESDENVALYDDSDDDSDENVALHDEDSSSAYDYDDSDENVATHDDASSADDDLD